MREIRNDPFFDLLKRYDPNGGGRAAGEVEYHLLRDDGPYEGPGSHREALRSVFENLAEEERAHSGERRDGRAADLPEWTFDVARARAKPLSPEAFFYCPNVMGTDARGGVRYDAGWVPDDENIGTTVPYWYALMEPVQGRRNGPGDFEAVNRALFPNGTDSLDIYEWTTDWSDSFDDGHEWYGACCWSVYDKTLNRYVVMLVSATD